MTPTSDHAEFESLLDYLKRSRGFDFGGYKRTSLGRRIQKRMEAVDIHRYPDYIDYLEVHPDEFTHLFNTILINVTGFFRDAAPWEYLGREILPRIIRGKRLNDPVRIWSAGCATGEEAYTLAMLFAEFFGVPGFADRVKIYATDIDEDALNKARQAIYTEREVEAIPPEYLTKYFEKVGNRYTFNKDLRRAVIFGQHDIIQDAPISRIDLLVCRNLLMYFNAETQSRVLARLHFALSDNGYLFLGRAEMLLTHTNIFAPVDLKLRIFSKIPKIQFRDRLMVMAQTGSEEAMSHLLTQVRLRDAAFDITPVAQLVVDVNGILTQINEKARKMLGVNNRDLGRPFQDLQISYRPVELRSNIDRAYSNPEPVIVSDVAWPTQDGEERFLDIEIHTISENGDTPLGAVLSFIDITNHKRLQQDLLRVNQELETAMEEIQSTNEELETTNEELQSTVEELETTNEELQSSNEELETMNEELHSSNEELETMNEEFRLRTDDLNQANSFLESILSSLKGGVVVLDKDLRIKVWNRKMEDLWGLRVDEVTGENFFNLDIGLPSEQLRKPIRSVMAGEADSNETRLEALNRRGRKIECRIVTAPLFNHDKTVNGVIMLTEEMDNLPM
jgi:two-component system CheB/CheR fusion protein